MKTTTKRTDAATISASDEDRWGAVARRDGRADGLFFYSVRTTGVYCRPSCPSRLARRENVRFHATSQEARQAGFRPCKRCRPDGMAVVEQQAAAVARACRSIEEAWELPDLGSLAAAAGLSRFHFQRVFKGATGLTPKAYATAYRARRIREQLPGSATVTQAIHAAGFKSHGRFYDNSTALLGMTPGQFRAGGEGVAIRFAVGKCSLGAILVAATGRGVCSIMLGDDPADLVREIQDLFPHAQLSGSDPDFERLVAQVVGFVDDPALGCGLPLDVRGTAFQLRVWQALREIPCGDTVSYTDLARRIGAPRSVRAVARACAANPVAVAIACHRVVRTDGALAGYRWGLARKRELLARERRR